MKEVKKMKLSEMDETTQKTEKPNSKPIWKETDLVSQVPTPNPRIFLDLLGKGEKCMSLLDVSFTRQKSTKPRFQRGLGSKRLRIFTSLWKGSIRRHHWESGSEIGPP